MTSPFKSAPQAGAGLQEQPRPAPFLTPLPPIIIDTREPIDRAYTFTPHPQERRKLETGDYSLKGFEDVISVDRKTISDLKQSVIKGRFWREVERASSLFAFAVVVEGTPEDLTSERVRSQVSPAAVLGAVDKLRGLGHQVQWAGDRARAALWTFEFLKRQHTHFTSEVTMREQEQLTGRVSRIKYQNAELTFTIGTIDDGSTHHAFKFFGAVGQNDKVTLLGQWQHDEKWGPQFCARSATFDLPIDPDGLIRYLVECPAFKGLGLARAAALVTTLGAETFSEKMKSLTPEEIAKAGKITPEVAKVFQVEWLKRSATNELATHLAAFDLTSSQVTKVIERLGAEALPILKANPYKLTEVDGFGFKTVDKIALRVGVEKTDARRLGAALEAVLGGVLQHGHTWSLRATLKGDAGEVLALDGTPEEVEGHIEGAIDSLLKSEALTEDVEGRVSLTWVKGAERAIAEDLLSRRTHPPTIKDPLAHYETLWSNFYTKDLIGNCNPQQREAVKAALGSCALVITGVAGTGKTTVVKTVLIAFAAAGIRDIALCAPTGKAARRLEQVTGRPAQTVHRLIGAGSAGYGVDVVEAQVVIVDEASMLDSLLLSALVRRLRYQTHLILVGDVNQLPPVGAGYPLRDIIRQGLCPVVSLNEVVRQAGRLQVNALGVLNGEVADNDTQATDKAWYLVKVKTKDKTEGADGRSDADIGRDALLSLVEGGNIERLGYDPIYQAQVLTAQHPGSLGTESLNIGLQRIFQRKLRGIEVTPPAEGERPSFLVGDKVIFTKNDYDRGLMNGDVGIIRGMEHTQKGVLKELIISWGAEDESDDRRIIGVTKGSFGDLSLAYALTVHKAQGSEYPCALVVAHKAHAHIHRGSGRNWLYTAVTRAAKTCVLIGDSWGLKNAAAHLAEDKRRTWLRLPLTCLLPDLAVTSEAGDQDQ